MERTDILILMVGGMMMMMSEWLLIVVMRMVVAVVKVLVVECVIVWLEEMLRSVLIQGWVIERGRLMWERSVLKLRNVLRIKVWMIVVY